MSLQLRHRGLLLYIIRFWFLIVYPIMLYVPWNTHIILILYPIMLYVPWNTHLILILYPIMLCVPWNTHLILILYPMMLFVPWNTHLILILYPIMLYVPWNTHIILILYPIMLYVPWNTHIIQHGRRVSAKQTPFINQQLNLSKKSTYRISYGIYKYYWKCNSSIIFINNFIISMIYIDCIAIVHLYFICYPYAEHSYYINSNKLHLYINCIKYKQSIGCVIYSNYQLRSSTQVIKKLILRCKLVSIDPLCILLKQRCYVSRDNILCVPWCQYIFMPSIQNL